LKVGVNGGGKPVSARQRAFDFFNAAPKIKQTYVASFTKKLATQR